MIYITEENTNEEYAAELKARIADLNELLEQSPTRDLLVKLEYRDLSTGGNILVGTISQRL